MDLFLAGNSVFLQRRFPFVNPFLTCHDDRVFNFKRTCWNFSSSIFTRSFQGIIDAR